MSYASLFTTKQTLATPQSQPMVGATQVAAAAGGYVYAVDDWQRLMRFLILGSEGASYYASARALTAENAAAVLRAIQTDGLRVVRTIVEVSEAARAPKNDPAIFALGLCLKTGDLDTRRAAAAAVARVCRTGTHLFQLVDVVASTGGFGRVTDRALECWYTDRTEASLAMQLAKYQARGGWSHRDVLRKCKPVPSTTAQEKAFAWSVGKPVSIASLETEGEALKVLVGFELAKAATSATEVASIIGAYGLPRECVPSAYLQSPAVWEALLLSGQGMPLTALVRNLGKLTQVGLLTPLSDVAAAVVERLGDVAALRASRLHPMALLLAQRTYARGKGDKGSLTWSPVGAVVDALDRAFYASFATTTSTNKRWLCALDVSGSMAMSQIAGSSLTPREVSAAMALVAKNTEPQVEVVAFGDTMVPLSLSAQMSLTAAVDAVSGLPFGATDCAQPMLHAIQRRLAVDVFVVYTDCETWAGAIHPVQALQMYRQQSGINAKLVVAGLVSNGFTIADPDDGGMLDVVGFDAAVPQAMTAFVTATT